MSGTMKKSYALAIIVVLLVVAVGAGSYSILVPPTAVTKTQVQTQTRTVTQTGAVTQTVTQPVTQTVTQTQTRTITQTVTQQPPSQRNLLQPPFAPMTPPPANKRDGTLILAFSAPPENYDPWHIGYGHLYLIWGLYDTLILMGQDGKFYPSVGTSVTYDPDKLTYTVTMRKDVKFHDGTPVTAKDVVASWDRGIKVPLRRSYAVASLKSVEALDDYTVRFTQVRPYVDFMIELGSHTSIHQAARLQKFGEEIVNQPPLGSGPFKFVEYVPGDRFVVERNDAYWAGPANVKRIVTRYIREESVRTLEVLKGGVHQYTVQDTRFIKDLEKGGAQMFEQPHGFCMRHISFGLEHPWARDINVRKALNYALNKKAVIDVLDAGLGTPSNGVVPPYLAPYYDPNFKLYEYNVAKAKEFMAKSAFPNGFTVKFIAGNEPDHLLAPILIDNFGAIGIKVVPDVVDAPVKSKRTLTFQYEMQMGGWCGSTPSPGGIFEIWWHTRQSKPFGWNTFHSNYTAVGKDIDVLIDKFMAEPDADKRLPLVRQFEQMVMENALFVPIVHQANYVVATHQVRGFGPIPHQGVGQFILTHAPQIGLSVWLDSDQPVAKPKM